MIRKCYSCDHNLSHYDKKCPKCGSVQKGPNVVRKAGTTVKRTSKPISGNQIYKDSKR